MQNLSPLEFFGYFASVLIVISLTMKSLVKLRWFNLFGAGSMAVYGLLIKAYPVAILNGLIVGIDIFYLYQMFSAKDFFEILEIRKDSKYLAYFLEFYWDEIIKFLPEFKFRVEDNQTVCLVLRNLVPAGLFISTPYEGNSQLIKLDFVIPGYRDFKIGKFIFTDKSKLFEHVNTECIYSVPGTPKHEKYLRRMGFKPVTKGEEKLYCRPGDKPQKPL